MHNEHSSHKDTLKVIKLVFLWSRDECKDLEMPWQNPWPVGLSLGWVPVSGDRRGGDWLCPCRQAQLDILERSPHPSDSSDAEEAASRWEALFLGHPGRRPEDPARPKMLLTAATDSLQPLHLCLSVNEFQESWGHTRPNQYHTPDRTWGNNSCHYNHKP